MLDGVHAGIDRVAGTGQALGVGSNAVAHPMGLLNDRRDLLQRHLGGFGILALHRSRAGRHILM